jgi:hypothetical protein
MRIMVEFDTFYTNYGEFYELHELVCTTNLTNLFFDYKKLS